MGCRASSRVRIPPFPPRNTSSLQILERAGFFCLPLSGLGFDLWCCRRTWCGRGKGPIIPEYVSTEMQLLRTAKGGELYTYISPAKLYGYSAYAVKRGNVLQSPRIQKDAITSDNKSKRHPMANDDAEAGLKEWPNPVDFLLRIPLYAEHVAIDHEQSWSLADLIYFNGTYDSYCTQCSMDSTFKVNAPVRPDELLRNFERERKQRALGMDPTRPKVATGVHVVSAVCTRRNHHTQTFIFLVSDKLTRVNEAWKRDQGVQKIGQHPSYGDLHLAEIKEYSSVLTNTQRTELAKSIGLASHDVGVGAYVYLRRVFEQLVEEAHVEAMKEAGWNEPAYLPARMGEKIALLAHHLPEFLIQNPKMYGLMSKGIHELTEAECLQHYDTLRIGIELILDEKLQIKRRKDKAAAASTALNKAFTGMGK